MPKPQKMIVVSMRPPPKIKPLKNLPVPTCYIRHSYTNSRTGHVTQQVMICRKSTR